MQTRFTDVLEAAEELPIEDKEELIRILQKRLVEYRRNQLLKDIESSNREFEQDLCKPMSADEIMREILS
ncbi:hypothetical protein BH20ACI4_BH20ACI4_34310 [soil metagenome]